MNDHEIQKTPEEMSVIRDDVAKILSAEKNGTIDYKVVTAYDAKSTQPPQFVSSIELKGYMQSEGLTSTATLIPVVTLHLLPGNTSFEYYQEVTPEGNIDDDGKLYSYEFHERFANSPDYIEAHSRFFIVRGTSLNEDSKEGAYMESQDDRM